MNDVIIIGAGIGGLTLALALDRRGIPCRVYEAAPEIRGLGLGINILPHATRELAELGLEGDLAAVAVTTREAVFYNRFGQLVPGEPLGRHAGYDWPQFSIRRGCQLVSWVGEFHTPKYKLRDWNRAGDLADFIHVFEDWKFDWLDVPAMIRNAETILEYPMVDQEPLSRWSFGRVTLLGDAAHPMVPRGSNGAGQAILDARALADCLARRADPVEALKEYEARRLEATASVVRMNRANPPDAILREVYVRTGDRPFRSIDEVISREELTALTTGYAKVAGYDQETLRSKSGLE